MEMALSSRSRRKWRASTYNRFKIAALTTTFLLSTILVLQFLTPSPSSSQKQRASRAFLQEKQSPISMEIGLFGEALLGFLPPDLPFTVFVPSHSAFAKMFQALSDKPGKPNLNSSDPGMEINHAVVSRIFGFSTVPTRVLSSMVPLGRELHLDSLSGFRLSFARAMPDGKLFVNNIACTDVDIVREIIIVHVIDGVLMDSEFEQSVVPYRSYDDDDDDDTEMH